MARPLQADARGFSLVGRDAELEREYPFGVVRQCLEPTVRREQDRERLLDGAARLAESVLVSVPDGGGVLPVGLYGRKRYLTSAVNDVDVHPADMSRGVTKHGDFRRRADRGRGRLGSGCTGQAA